MTSIVDVEVSASPHRTLNTIRGVLSEDDFLDASEEEILEGLKDAGVVAVKRIMFRKDGKETPSKHVILTFERHTLPETVKAGYLQCRIRPYVPNPQRCFRCQRFGHGSRSCRGKETCAKCGSQEHVADICEAAARCSNCSGPHPAYSRTCPLWRQEKEILSLKAKENITYLEAKKKLSFLSKGGYAEVVRRGPAPHLETRATQSSVQTFRPKKKFEPGTMRYSLHKQAQASLNSGLNLRDAVRLPPREDMNDWLAVHVVDFFNRINLIYGTISDYCTEESCPRMSGGPKFEYLWADGHKYKKPTALPAPQYISHLMDWVEAQINNEDIFPVTMDVRFPRNFVPTCKKILARLFRVFVHVYIHHFDKLVAIGAEAHVNTCYKHFYYFITEFDLVSQKELEPLTEMTQKVCKESVIMSPRHR
ncbi:MOB kinase activator-like 3 isoform X1 [Ixodes scapularis]